jgi:hypothetical protein
MKHGLPLPFNAFRNPNAWDNVPRENFDAEKEFRYAFDSAVDFTFKVIPGLFLPEPFRSLYFTNLAVSETTTWVQEKLSPDYKAPAFESGGLLINSREATGIQDFVYGEIRKGGVITFFESTGTENTYLHQVIVLAGHEVDSIGDIYLNDDIVTLDANGFVTSNNYNSKVRIKKHDGSQTSADADLVSETSASSSFVGYGIAYLYVRYEYDIDAFPTGGIPIVTATVRGKKVYDPRTSTTGYSSNAALCIRDFITSSYGLSDSSIDDTSFQAAANECDEDIELSGSNVTAPNLVVGSTYIIKVVGTTNWNTVAGTSGVTYGVGDSVTVSVAGTGSGEAKLSEKRYTVNGVIRANRAVGKVLSDLTSACAGSLFWGTGAWKLKAGAYSSPVKTLTLDDVRSNIQLSTRINMRDNYNTVRGIFTDKDNGFITADYPQITSATFLAEDADEEVLLDLPLPYTTSSATAQRIAKLSLLRGREQMTLSAQFGLEAAEIEVGDIIAFTNPRYGFSAKEFEVVSWALVASGEAGDLRIDLRLRETSQAAFDWNAEETEIISNNTTLPSVRDGTVVTGLTLSDGGSEVQTDGTVVNALLASWTASTNTFVIYYEVEWGQTSSANRTTFISNTTSAVLSPVIDGVNYTVKVRSVSISGYRGAFASATGSSGGDITAPNAPTAVTAAGGYKYITISWTNPTAADLKHVEIYENSSNTTTGATVVGTSAGNSFVRTNLGLAETKYYFLKAVDFSDNKSGFSSGASATTEYIDNTDFENGVRQLILDQNLDIIAPVSSLPASGDFTGQQVFLTTNGKLYQWDGSAWGLTLAAADGGDITDATITGNKVVANTITGGLLATSGIITSAAQMDNAVIETAKIKDLAVERIKIGNNAVSNVATDTIVNQSVTGNYNVGSPTTLLSTNNFAAIAGLTNISRVTVTVFASQSQLNANGSGSRYGMLISVIAGGITIGSAQCFLLNSNTSGLNVTTNLFTAYQRIGTETISLVCPWVSNFNQNVNVTVTVNCGYFTSTGAWGSQTISGIFDGALETEYLAK